MFFNKYLVSIYYIKLPNGVDTEGRVKNCVRLHRFNVYHYTDFGSRMTLNFIFINILYKCDIAAECPRYSKKKT